MKIKRYFAPDVRQAMRQIKEQLGEDAVILSNKRVNGGVEIIAALDYDESAIRQQVADVKTPAAEKTANPFTAAKASANANAGTRVPPVSASEPVREASKPQIVWSQEPTLEAMKSELKNMRGLLEGQLANLTDKEYRHQRPCEFELRRRLSQLGVGTRLSEQLTADLPEGGNVDELWRRLLGKLAVSVQVTNDDILANGGVVSLVGATGVGKTTTIAKLAARFALRHGSRSVALISTDNFRIGAHEQLKAYARILDVPIRFAGTPEAMQEALDYFCDKPLVLIDTAGVSQRDMRLAQQLAVLRNEGVRVRNYLVLSAIARLAGMDDVVRNFQAQGIDLHGCILTKLDESIGLGHALDVVIRHQLPIAYLSDGQRVPEDLQAARAHTLVSRSVAMMQENEESIADEVPGVRVGEGIY